MFVAVLAAACAAFLSHSLVEQVEFLGMAGVFGTIISGVQALVFERAALAEVEWTTPIILFTFGYGLR